jgi:hypothetical protein
MQQICCIAEAEAKRAFLARRQQQRPSKLHWRLHLVVLLFAFAVCDVVVGIVHRPPHFLHWPPHSLRLRFEAMLLVCRACRMLWWSMLSRS